MRPHHRSALLPLALAALAAATTLAVTSPAVASSSTFLSSLGPAHQWASTVPANGDVNPYGVAIVPTTTGTLVEGDVLVSNFNDKANVQGTGTTVVEISPGGKVTTFAQLDKLPSNISCPGGVGMTTALVVLRDGWVVVGSFPAAASGALPNINPAGCLIVLNNHGQPVTSWSGPNINGPWDMTEVPTLSGAALFVSNALSRPDGVQDTPSSGQCTVVRIDVSLPHGSVPKMTSSTVVGAGFYWKANKAAFILAPTGLAVNKTGTLYVAETPSNHITDIPNALSRSKPVMDGHRTLISGGALNAPLGVTLAPDGDLLVVNGNDGNAVEISPQGKQVATKTLVKNGAGALFGLEVTPNGKQLLFVNDSTNALDEVSS